jgi:hypothetical protein
MALKIASQMSPDVGTGFGLWTETGLVHYTSVAHRVPLDRLAGWRGRSHGEPARGWVKSVAGRRWIAGPRSPSALYALPSIAGRLAVPANISAQRMRAVSCIATKSVRIEPIVIASPVNPSKKKA